MADDSVEDDQLPCCSKQLKHQTRYLEENGWIDNKEFTTGTTCTQLCVLKNMEMTKKQVHLPTIGKKGPKKQKKKKNKTLVGRIEKPKRITPKRKTKIKKANPGPKRENFSLSRKNAFSSSSISTITSRSSSRSSACKYCGHRCCKRIYEFEKRHTSKRKPKKLSQRMKRKFRRNRSNTPRVECASVQAGSISMMLSPLCISRNLTKFRQLIDSRHCEVSPEMIVQAIKELTMWKEAVNTDAILNYLLRNFPVNSNKEELLEDLSDKLNIAKMVGIIWQTPDGTWTLSHGFQKRKLTKNHVSLFWDVYVDTLKPVTKKNLESDRERSEGEDNNKHIVTLYDNEEYI